MASIESPFAILFDDNGIKLAVSSSQTITSGSQPVFLLAGTDANDKVTIPKISSDRNIHVAGDFYPITQSTKNVPYTTSNLTSFVAATTASNILVANPERKTATFFVEGKRNFYIGLGNIPTLTLYTTKIAPGGYYVAPDYFTGPVWVLSTNNDAESYINVTEIFS